MIRDQRRFRRHEGACPFYRENWIASEDQRNRKNEIVLYEIYCLREFPPETVDEQHRCMAAETRCWRDNVSHRSVMRREKKEREEVREAAS